MSPSPLRRFLPLIALLLLGAAAECAPPDAGLPVGTWRWESAIGGGATPKVVFTSIVSITSDGRTHSQFTSYSAEKAGSQIGYGKFAGRDHVSWTIAADAQKTVRVGDEIYVYPDPAHRTRLVGGDPPGYSLEDYQSLGGILSPKERKAWGDPNAIEIAIFKIQGRDLLLLTAFNKTQLLYKRVK